MPTLPLIQWPLEVIKRRLEFLESAGRFVPPAPDQEVPTPSERQPARNGPVIDFHAMMMAADLAFATNQTERGLGIMQGALDAMIARGNLYAAALPGSVIGRIVTRTTPEGFQIADRAGERRVIVEPPAPSPTSITLLADLLIASLLSDAPSDRMEGLSHQWPSQVLGFGEPLLHALAAFGEAPGWPVARDGLLANSVAWLERLGRMRRDEEHWQHARVRGALVDMRRLVFEIALLRRPDGSGFLGWRGAPADDGLTAGIERFVRSLARQITEADGVLG